MLIPYMIEQLLTGKYFAGVTCQAEKQIKLFTSKFNLVAFYENLTSRGINYQVLTECQSCSIFCLAGEKPRKAASRCVLVPSIPLKYRDAPYTHVRLLGTHGRDHRDYHRMTAPRWASSLLS